MSTAEAQIGENTKQQQKLLMHNDTMQQGKELKCSSSLALFPSSSCNVGRGPSLSPSSGNESLNVNVSTCSGDSRHNKSQSSKKSVLCRLTSKANIENGETINLLQANGKRPQTRRQAANSSQRAKRRKIKYEVENIECVKCVNTAPVFFVKWLNYPSSENTWEPLKNVIECALLKGFIESATAIHVKAIADISQAIKDEIKANNLCIKPAELNMKEIEAYNPLKRKIDLILLAQFINAPSRLKKEPAKIRQRLLRTFLIEPLYYKRQEQLASLEEWETSMNMIEHEAPIAVLNTVDFDILDPKFQYIMTCVLGQGVAWPINLKVGCKCPGGCAPSSQCCACLAGSNFAYGKTGHLRICPGKAIFECNDNCACFGGDCTNRVIQKGRKNSLCLFRTSNGRGWGVRTEKKMRKGDYVGEYVGEIITCDEANERGKQYDAVGRTYLFDLDYNENADNIYTIDAAFQGNVCRFFNHSCNPNLSVFPFWIDNLDSNMPRLSFFTLRPIKAGEELTFDYMPGNIGVYNHENLSKVKCRCGAQKCRKVLF